MKKKRKKKKSADLMDIIVLAYFHRYGFFAVILFFLFLQSRLAVIGIALIVYATYTILGYLFRWKHIYCSYQNMYHQKMTPNHVNWKDIQKRDVYGVSAIFFVFGVALMIVS